MTFSLLAAAALANGLLIGLIPTVVDGIKPCLKARLDSSDGRIEWFSRLFYFAWLPTMPFAGWLLDTWSNREILLFGGLIPLILGLAWLGLARSAALLLLNAIFLGAAYSVLTTAAIRLMTVAFFPEHVDNPLNIAALNLGFVTVGVGALVGPWIVQAIERWGGLRQGLLYLSIALLAPAVLTALCESYLFPRPPAAVASWYEVFTHPQLGMIAGVILVYFALENCLEYWPAAYLKEIGYQERGLQVGLFSFWLAFIAMRGAAAWWLYEHPTHGFSVIVGLIIASAIVLGALAQGYEFGSGSIWFWLLGACYGPMLPGFLGIALDLYSRGHPLPTSVFGLLLALSGFDTLVVRPVMNVFTQDRPARSVMHVPTYLALVLVGVLLVLAFIRNET